MRYDVYLFPIVQLKVCGIEATSQQEAIVKAEVELDLEEAIRGAEFADEVAYYLVDEEGDEEYERSRWYTWAEETPVEMG